MPSESVTERVSRLAVGKDQEELRVLLGSIVDALQAITAKLDADAGVTDTNYAALLATFVRD